MSPPVQTRFLVSARARRAINVLSVLFVLLALLLALAVPAMLSPTDRPDGVYICAATLVVLAAAFQHARQRAESTLFTDAGVQQRTVFGMTSLPWARITSARIAGGRLVLRGRAFERMVVPCGLFEDSEGVLRYVAERLSNVQ